MTEKIEIKKPVYTIESTHIYHASCCAVCHFFKEHKNGVKECHREMPKRCYVVESALKCDWFMWHGDYCGEEK